MLNIYEDGIREAMKSDFESGALREVGESSKFFAPLAKAYPNYGSKIAWSKVPGSIEVPNSRSKLGGPSYFETAKCVKFFDEIIKRFDLKGNVTYVGDSLTDFALEGSVDAIREALPQLLSIPQHHYLIGTEFSWCASWTMEGDMAFGFRPTFPDLTEERLTAKRRR